MPTEHGALSRRVSLEREVECHRSFHGQKITKLAALSSDAQPKIHHTTPVIRAVLPL